MHTKIFCTCERQIFFIFKMNEKLTRDKYIQYVRDYLCGFPSSLHSAAFFFSSSMIQSFMIVLIHFIFLNFVWRTYPVVYDNWLLYEFLTFPSFSFSSHLSFYTWFGLDLTGKEAKVRESSYFLMFVSFGATEKLRNEKKLDGSN